MDWSSWRVGMDEECQERNFDDEIMVNGTNPSLIVSVSFVYFTIYLKCVSVCLIDR